jgi:hypothetical protein
MRIIIEFDTSAQPEVQIGSQTYNASNTSANTQLSTSGGRGINAGEPKVAGLQMLSTQQEPGSANYDQASTDVPSAGSAPQNIN